MIRRGPRRNREVHRALERRSSLEEARASRRGHGAAAVDRGDEVAAFLRGDPDQLGRVVGSIRMVVRSFQLGDRELELDLVQEVLCRVMESLSERRFHGASSLKTYAGNVARFTCLEHIRRRRKKVLLDPDSVEHADRRSSPEATLLRTEAHRENLRAFAALDPECRELLRMVCLEGISYRDIASRLGISEAALKSRIHRCRLTCREAVHHDRRFPRRATEGEGA